MIATEFYLQLFDAVISDKSPDTGTRGLYFLENGEYNQYEVAKAIAQALFEHGKITSPKPSTLSTEELESEKLKGYNLVSFISNLDVNESTALMLHGRYL